jgi:CBS domain-containing protein
MTIIRDLLEVKSSETNYSVDINQTVFDALKMMASAHIGAVLITEGGKIVGIYTERDYVIKGELEGRTASTTTLRDVMTGSMYTVNMDTSVEQCMALMNTHRIRHLPVIEGGQLVGLVSMRDVITEVLANKESEIRGLENYIMSTGFAS